MEKKDHGVEEAVWRGRTKERKDLAHLPRGLSAAAGADAVAATGPTSHPSVPHLSHGWSHTLLEHPWLLQLCSHPLHTAPVGWEGKGSAGVRVGKNN